jgi:hypothetical protein
MSIYAVEIDYDPALFSARTILKIDNRVTKLTDPVIAAGHSEVIDEFMDRSTDRARRYLDSYFPTLAKLSPSARNAAISTKMIEMSILWSPQPAAVGFPIDALQLRSRTGVKWIKKKSNCQAD